MNVRFVKSYLLHGANNIHTIHTKIGLTKQVQITHSIWRGWFLFFFCTSKFCTSRIFGAKNNGSEVEKDFPPKVRELHKKRVIKKICKSPL